MSTTDGMIRPQGAAQFGRGAPPLGAKVNTAEDAQKLVDLFVSYGHDKLDTSRVYGAGTSEEVRTRTTIAHRLPRSKRKRLGGRGNTHEDAHDVSPLQLISQLDLKGCTVDTKSVF